jgi:hypothetical protein
VYRGLTSLIRRGADTAPPGRYTPPPVPPPDPGPSPGPSPGPIPVPTPVPTPPPDPGPVDVPDDTAFGSPAWSKIPEASGLASSTIAGTAFSTAREEAVVTEAAAGGLRARRVIVFEPTPCARRILPGCWFPPPPPPPPGRGNSGARNTRCVRSGWLLVCSCLWSSTLGASAILTTAAMTTSVTCSAADAAACVSAPNRRCGSRGVQGASGSR